MNQAIRKLWTAKIKGNILSKPLSAKVFTPDKPQKLVGCILGIDPSLRGTGIAVIRSTAEGSLSLCFSQTVKLSPKYSFFDCLGCIFKAVSEVAKNFDLQAAALEETIFVQNVRVAQKLGASRGAAIAALNVHNIPIQEYLPLRIKKAIVGFGQANKAQVIKMVQALLSLKKGLPHDESDAAAVALCHIFNHKLVTTPTLA